MTSLSNDKTLVTIKKETRDKLKLRGIKGDTYDTVILKLLRVNSEKGEKK